MVKTPRNYFVYLKNTILRQTLTNVINKNGNVLDEQSDILKEIALFYKSIKYLKM